MNLFKVMAILEKYKNRDDLSQNDIIKINKILTEFEE